MSSHTYAVPSSDNKVTLNPIQLVCLCVHKYMSWVTASRDHGLGNQVVMANSHDQPDSCRLSSEGPATLSSHAYTRLKCFTDLSCLLCVHCVMEYKLLFVLCIDHTPGSIARIIWVMGSISSLVVSLYAGLGLQRRKQQSTHVNIQLNSRLHAQQATDRFFVTERSVPVHA